MKAAGAANRSRMNSRAAAIGRCRSRSWKIAWKNPGNSRIVLADEARRSKNRRCADRFTTQSEPATSIRVGTSIVPASSSKRVDVSYRSSRTLTAIWRKIRASAA